MNLASARPWWRAFFICVSLSLLNSLSVHASHADLANERTWRLLGHYQEGWSQNTSQADGKEFFLSDQGKHSPEAELLATINAFESENDQTLIDSSITCRFPARYLWLKNHVSSLKHDPLKECAGLRAYYEKIAPKSVSLIFSSYYINTPASAFGHTLLRFNKYDHSDRARGEETDLLDYGVNYAAAADTNNGLMYALSGVFGWFKGVFSTLPYYYKVREYNDYESRDLWEYGLDFTQEQIDLMVAHVWELHHTYFDYYYFTENCSYHLLALLEIGNPKLNLRRKVPFYVIPIDTVRAVTSTKGLVVSRRYRASGSSRLKEIVAELSADEQALAKEIALNPEKTEVLIASVSDQKTRAAILDASVEWFDMQHASALLREDVATKNLRHNILSERSVTDAISPERGMSIADQAWPDRGHKTRKISLGYGHRDGEGGFFNFGYRFALHDALDPLPGQPEFSEIIFGSLNFRLQREDYQEFRKLYLDDVELFRIASFEPSSRWKTSPAWSIKVGGRTIQDTVCDQCFAGNVQMAFGSTVGFERNFLSVLMKGEVDASSKLVEGARVLIGPEVMMRLAHWDQFSLMAVLAYKWQEDFRNSFGAEQVFTRQLEVRYHLSKHSWYVRGEAYDKIGESVSLGLQRFY